MESNGQKKRWRILILGSGALGLYYGGRLAQAGHGVVFGARRENLAALGQHGLHARSLRGDFHVQPVEATDFEGAPKLGPYELILVTLKAHHTSAELLAPFRSALAPNGVVLTLQNGVDSAAALLKAFGADRVLAAIAFIGAERSAPGSVEHTAAGHVVLGVPAGGTCRRAEDVAVLLQSSNIDAALSDNIAREQWRKLVWNAPFNGITALTGSFAHETLQQPESREAVRKVMCEVVAVARALGLDLPDETVDKTIALTENSGLVRTSTLVDREKGRPMEIDALYRPVLREAKRLGVPVPATEFLFGLLSVVNAALAGHTRRPA